MLLGLALIIIIGLLADYLFRLMRLPGLVGMLLGGVVVGPYLLDIIDPAFLQLSSEFRKIALIVILLRAGLSLHMDQLKKVGKAAISLAIIPALFEIAGVMLVAPALLGLSLFESTMLGIILAAISPAVVVPLMIGFMVTFLFCNIFTPITSLVSIL